MLQGSEYKTPPWLILAVASAALLPLITFIALQSAFSAQSERYDVERAAIDHARRVVTAADAQLERTRGAAAALITTKAVRDRDWPAAYQRAKEITDQNPDWDAVILWDKRSGRELFDTGRPFGGAPLRPQFKVDPTSLGGPSDLVVGGIQLNAEHCPCIYAHAASGPGEPYVVSIRLIPASFQRIVLKEGSGTLMTSLVDAGGLTIARTLNWGRQIGRSAVSSNAAAIKSGQSGVYKGTTFEGIKNYSAFWRSPVSHWSAHIAFKPSVIEASWIRSATAIAVAAIASLSVAGIVLLLTSRYFSVQRKLQQQVLVTVTAEANMQLAVARDLHDGILQFLTGLVMRLHTVRQDTAAEKHDAQRLASDLEKLQGEIRREQRELRRFIEGLTSDDQVEPLSLFTIAAILSRRWSLAVSVQPESADSLIPKDLQRDVQFIIREAVSNAARHGQASEIGVRVQRDANSIQLQICDDGCGFSGAQSDVPSHPAVTPATISGRAKRHGGSVSIDSSCHGATLHIHIPVS